MSGPGAAAVLTPSPLPNRVLAQTPCRRNHITVAFPLIRSVSHFIQRGVGEAPDFYDKFVSMRPREKTSDD